MDSPSADELRRTYRTTVFIGSAMLGSLFIYAVLVEMIRTINAPFGGFAPFPAVDILRYIFLALAVADFFLIRFLRDRILTGKVSVQRAPAATRGTSENMRRLSTASIVAFALCEAVAIYGLLLFLLAGSRSDFYGFLFLSLVLYAIYFPRYGQWEDWIREQERGQTA